MTLPAIRLLKNYLPDSSIYVAALHSVYPVFENIPEIADIIPIPTAFTFKNTLETADMLKKYRFDSGILFTNSFHSALLFRKAGIRKLYGYSRDCRGFLLHKKVKFLPPEKHHTYFYINLANSFLEENGPGGFTPGEEHYSKRLGLTYEDEERGLLTLVEYGFDLSGTTIVVAPFSAYGSAKEWGAERFVGLFERIFKEKPGSKDIINIALLGSEKEKQKIDSLIDAVKRRFDRPPPLVNFAGVLYLREAISVISQGDLFIGNDSGLMHIASSLDIPLLALFGPTLPHNSGPTNENSRVLYHKQQCAPCRYRECPIENHPCMSTIPVNEAFDGVKFLLSLHTGPSPVTPSNA